MLNEKRGSHTFAIITKCSYTEIQNIRSNQLCIRKYHDKYFLNVSYEIVEFKEIGVEIQLHQSLVRRSWIKLIVNPSSLLSGEYRPTALFSDVKRIPEVKHRLRSILDECGIDRKLKEFKLSRDDLARDRYYPDRKDKDAALTVYKKSFLMPRYAVIPFEGFPEAKEANEHSWTISNKSHTTEFSVYDKTYELASRHAVYIDDEILRLELRLGNKRIKQLVPKGPWDEQLKEIMEQQNKLMNKFLHRLHQDIGEIVTDETAFQLIKDSSFRTKNKEAMRKIVELATECEALMDVKKKMGINREKFKVLLDKFKKIGINPITLKNGSDYDKLPSFLF